ncbi:hypothetical protein JOF56_003410 [Kibdelosporangium banguiense]|uniref:Uncharacterized protein n=1 Tax=Kibdelosporangium banguiense TaxID=1365924 RepID=A0ABS4TF39_9PSEU|nr:hypothetical protein [Kibdelosporangium banguiense]MBP2323025.1 hypothetical protein [Kibdelosporangium banguiense]
MTADLHSPPSRFAVFETLDDDSGGQLVAWGLAAPGNVDVHSVEPGMCGRFSTVAAVSFLFGDSCEVVWIDPEPPLDGDSSG